jgi:uncharacterized protein
MLRNTLESIILSQQSWFQHEPHEILRDQLNQYQSVSPFGYVLTGVRRSGKSTLLKQIMRVCNASCYLNFEDSRIAGFEFNDFLTVEHLFTALFGNNDFLFFDKIQNVPGWERYVRDAIDRKKTVFVTGSNAKLLSRELGTKLTGRHLDYEVFPFSYQEFLNFKKQTPGPASFLEYITHGGFPGYLHMDNQVMLSTLVSDILIRDIFARYNLRNQETYRMIVQFLLSNTGKEVSYNNLKNTFEIGSASSVMEFLHFLADAYLLFLVPKYDSSLKVQAKNPRKVYIIDQGLANFSSASGSPDKGRLLENTLFLEIRRSSQKIWYFKGKKECDFIYRDNKNTFEALQVTWELGFQNEQREIAGLVEAMDALNLKNGIIITYDQEDTIKTNGKTISLIPGWKWIIKRQEKEIQNTT